MNLLETIRQVLNVLRENLAPFVAGSLAYSAFVSVVPLLVLVFVLATTLGQQQLVDQALAATEQYLTPAGRDVFARALQDSAGRTAASVVSVLFLLWSGLRVFRGLDIAFSLFYNTTDTGGLLDHVRDALVVVGSLAVVLIASVAIGLASTAFPVIPLGGLLGPVLLVAPLIIALLPVFYVFPDTDVDLREVLPGVLIAAVGWAVLQGAFQLYVSTAGQYQVYGVIGAVLLVLTWLYVAAFLLLLGAAVNVVLADRAPAAASGSWSRRGVTADE